MNHELLNEVVDETGIRKTVIAERMGMTKGQFYAKLKGHAAWRVDEAKKFADVLGLSKKQLTDIFLS